MEEYKRIAAKTLTNEEKTLYTNSNGVIIKTIFMHNTADNEIETALSFDGVVLLFKIAPKETLIVDKVILTNILKGKGNGVNIHISGIQLGGA